MKSTNYFDTFIVVSGDCLTTVGTKPVKETSVAGLQYWLLRDRPYFLTSDDLLFEVHVLRNAIAEADRKHSGIQTEQTFSSSARSETIAHIRHMWGKAVALLRLEPPTNH